VTSSLIAIDPGTFQSAYIVMGTDKKIFDFDIVENEKMFEICQSCMNNEAAIEMIRSYGQCVGQEVFDTVKWLGAYWGVFKRRKIPCDLYFRPDIKSSVCGNPNGDDADVRRHLIMRYGVQGKKKNPGPTYGIRKDIWSALAVAEHHLFLREYAK
jgi:Holliday junction resolvasome RuvABC endonuclease subunit